MNENRNEAKGDAMAGRRSGRGGVRSQPPSHGKMNPGKRPAAQDTRPAGQVLRRSQSDRQGGMVASPPRRRDGVAASRPPQRRNGAPTARPPKQVRRSRREPIQEEIPEVVYIPPRPFQFSRFVLRLTTAVVLVAALTFGVSLFFRVQTVTVSGAQKYKPWTVMEASGIAQGDSLFALSKAKICGKITTALPYVQNVRVGIKLPDTVMIQIGEIPVTYAVEGEAGGWWLMTAQGRLVEQVASSDTVSYTQVHGVQLTNPVAGEQAAVATEANRLELALDVLQALEGNDFLGDMTSLDLSDPANLTLSYDGRYEILLGDGSNADYKLACARSAMEQLAPYQSGILDVTLSGTEKVIFTPVA